MRSATVRQLRPPTYAASCTGCKQRTQCFLAIPLPGEENACADAVQRRYKVANGDRLYRRNSPFTSVYQVCSGSFKTQRETLDGSLVVTGFFLPGDMVGVEAIADHHYQTDAVATADSTVCELDFCYLQLHCSTKPGLQSWMIAQIGAHVRRMDTDLCWSTGLQTQQRVLRFFVGLSDRLVNQATSDDVVHLPMKKQDIARYLQMTPETLSRNLAHLRRNGLLSLKHDSFTLPDMQRARQVTQL